MWNWDPSFLQFLNAILRIGLIIVVGAGFLYISARLLWDWFVRLRTINYLGIGFAITSMATFLHLFSLGPSQGILFNTMNIISFHGVGLFFIWLHFQLLQDETIPIPMLSFLVMLLTATFLLTGFNVFVSETPSLFDLNMIILLVLAGLTLVAPIRISLHDFHFHHHRKSLAEASCYALLFVTIACHVSNFFFFSPNTFSMILMQLVANLSLLFSTGGLIFLYTWYPHLMHRVPFHVWYVIGFHDSGMLFFQQEIPHSKPNGLEVKRRLPYLSGMLSAIDAIFKHILEQDVIFTIQKSAHVEMIFQRDPQKRLGYIIIADRHSHYLLRALDTLVKMTTLPKDEDQHQALHQSNHLDEKKEASQQYPVEDDMPSLIDQARLNRLIRPLVKKVFPFIFFHELSSTSTPSTLTTISRKHQHQPRRHRHPPSH